MNFCAAVERIDEQELKICLALQLCRSVNEQQVGCALFGIINSEILTDPISDTAMKVYTDLFTENELAHDNRINTKFKDQLMFVKHKIEEIKAKQKLIFSAVNRHRK